MGSTFKPIDQVALLALLEANKSQRVHAFGLKDGWHLVVRHGRAARALSLQDGCLRIFPNLDSLDCYLREHGISYFLVDIGELDNAATDAATTERLREAKKAMEYDAWFRQQVKESLDDPGPTVPDSVVEEKFAARRAELLKKLAKV